MNIKRRSGFFYFVHILIIISFLWSNIVLAGDCTNLAPSTNLPVLYRDFAVNQVASDVLATLSSKDFSEIKIFYEHGIERDLREKLGDVRCFGIRDIKRRKGKWVFYVIDLKRKELIRYVSGEDVSDRFFKLLKAIDGLFSLRTEIYEFKNKSYKKETYIITGKTAPFIKCCVERLYNYPAVSAPSEKPKSFTAASSQILDKIRIISNFPDNSVFHFFAGEKVKVRIRLEGVYNGDDNGMRVMIRTDMLSFNNEGRYVDKYFDDPSENPGVFEKPSKRDVELKRNGDVWETELRADYCGNFYLTAYVVDPATGRRKWINVDSRITVFPKWVKGAGIAVTSLRHMREKDPENRERLGTFTDLVWDIREKAKQGFNALLLLPITATVEDSPYEQLSPYALNPGHIDWEKVPKEQRVQIRNEDDAEAAVLRLEADPEFKTWLKEQGDKGILRDLQEYAQLKAVNSIKNENLEFCAKLLTFREFASHNIFYQRNRQYDRLMSGNLDISQYTEEEIDFVNRFADSYLDDEDIKKCGVFLMHYVPILNKLKLERISELELSGDIFFSGLKAFALYEQFIAQRQLREALETAHSLKLNLLFDQPFFPATEGVISVFHPGRIEWMGIEGKRIKYAGCHGDGPDTYNEQHWVSLARWNYNAGSEAEYRAKLDAIVRPINYWLDLGFGGFRWDAIHFGNYDLWAVLRHKYLQGREVFPLGEQIAGTYKAEKKLLDLGYVLYKTTQFKRDNPSDIEDSFLESNRDPWFVTADTHDSPRIPDLFRHFFTAGLGENPDPVLVNKAMLTEFAFGSSVFCMMSGAEYGDNRPINIFGTIHDWKGESPHAGKKEEKDISEYVAKLNELRRTHPAMRAYGNLIRLDNRPGNVFTDGGGVSAMARYHEEGSLVMVNNLSGFTQDVRVYIPFGQFYINPLKSFKVRDVLAGTKARLVSKENYNKGQDYVTLELAPGESVIWEFQPQRLTSIAEWKSGINTGTRLAELIDRLSPLKAAELIYGGERKDRFVVTSYGKPIYTAPHAGLMGIKSIFDNVGDIEALNYHVYGGHFFKHIINYVLAERGLGKFRKELSKWMFNLFNTKGSMDERRMAFQEAISAILARLEGKLDLTEEIGDIKPSQMTFVLQAHQPPDDQRKYKPWHRLHTLRSYYPAIASLYDRSMAGVHIGYSFSTTLLELLMQFNESAEKLFELFEQFKDSKDLGVEINKYLSLTQKDSETRLDKGYELLLKPASEWTNEDKLFVINSCWEVPPQYAAKVPGFVRLREKLGLQTGDDYKRFIGENEEVKISAAEAKAILAGFNACWVAPQLRGKGARLVGKDLNGAFISDSVDFSELYKDNFDFEKAAQDNRFCAGFAVEQAKVMRMLPKTINLMAVNNELKKAIEEGRSLSDVIREENPEPCGELYKWEFGHIELMACPGHVILPLLIDQEDALANDGLAGERLKYPFKAPDDARYAIRYMKRLFKEKTGLDIVSVWPAECAVCEKSLKMLREEGILVSLVAPDTFYRTMDLNGGILENNRGYNFNCGDIDGDGIDEFIFLQPKTFGCPIDFSLGPYSEKRQGTGPSDERSVEIMKEEVRVLSSKILEFPDNLLRWLSILTLGYPIDSENAAPNYDDWVLFWDNLWKGIRDEISYVQLTSPGEVLLNIGRLNSVMVARTVTEIKRHRAGSWNKSLETWAGKNKEQYGVWKYLDLVRRALLDAGLPYPGDPVLKAVTDEEKAWKKFFDAETSCYAWHYDPNMNGNPTSYGDVFTRLLGEAIEYAWKSGYYVIPPFVTEINGERAYYIPRVASYNNDYILNSGLMPVVRSRKKSGEFVCGKTKNDRLKEGLYDELEKLFSRLDRTYTSPEQEKTFYQRVKAALKKLEAIGGGNKDAFQDEELFRSRGRVPVSADSFKQLSSMYEKLDTRYPGLLHAVLGLLDTGKILEFKSDPHYTGLNFANHPEAGAEILKDKGIFAELGFSDEDTEIALTLVRQHGFIGQAKRGEVTDEIFKPILRLAIERKDLSILELYFLVNVIDTAVVWEGIFTEEFYEWFYEKYIELIGIAAKAVEEGKSADEVLREMAEKPSAGSEIIAIKRLCGIRPQSTREEIEEAVDKVFSGMPQLKEEFFALLSRQENSFSFWYPEMALSWLDSIETQIKFIYLTMKLAEEKCEKRGSPVDINFYDIAKEVNRRDEARLNAENRDYIARVLESIVISGPGLFENSGIGFEFDDKNNALNVIFDAFSVIGLDREKAGKRIEEIKVEIDKTGEDSPMLFVRKAEGKNPKKVGIFAASFDPIQRTHKLIIEKALREYNLDEMVLVVTKTHILKKEFGAELEERIFMLEQMVKDMPNVSIVVSQQGRFVEMAEGLNGYYPDAQFYFTIGSDNFEQMFDEEKSGNTKDDLERFFSSNRLIVVPRGYYTKHDTDRILIERSAGEYKRYIYYMNIPREYRFDSSTEARRYSRDGVPENKLLPQVVLRIVKALGLYEKRVKDDLKVFKTQPLKVIFVNLTSPRHKIIAEPQGINALIGDLRTRYGSEVIVSVVDTQFGMGAREVIEELKRQKPDVIGLSAQLESDKLLYEILDLIGIEQDFKNRNVLTVVGHNLPTNENKDILSRYPFAVTVRGEGELAVREIIRFMRGETSIYDIPAASFVRDGKIVENDGVPISVNDLGIPARDELLEILNRGGDIWIETSRGCGWGNCAFCFKDPFRAHKWEPFPDEVVLDGLLYLYKMGAKHVSLTDPEFLGGGRETLRGIRRARHLAEEMIKRGIKLRMAFSCRVDSIYKENDTPDISQEKIETFKILKGAGFENVFLGAESGSDRQLRESYRKGATVKENEESIRILRGLGFNVCIGFIPLDPYADLDDLRKNIEFLRKNNLYLEVSFPLNQLKVQAGTAYYTRTFLDGLLGERGKSLHTFGCRYKYPDVQKIADIINAYGREVGSVFYVLKYMYRTKDLNRITGEEVERDALKDFFVRYNKLEIDFLEALVNNVNDGYGLYKVINEFRKKRLGLVLEVEARVKDKTIKDENKTLAGEIEKIRKLLDDFTAGRLTDIPEHSIVSLADADESPEEKIIKLFEKGFPQAVDALQALNVYAGMVKERGGFVRIDNLPSAPLCRRLELHIKMSDDLETITLSKVLDDSQVYMPDGTVDYSRLKLEHIAAFPSCHLMFPDNYIAKHFSGETLSKILILFMRGGKYTEYMGVTTNHDSRVDIDTWSTNIDTVYLHKALKETGVFDRDDIKTVLEVGTGGGHIAAACAQNIRGLEKVMISDISLYALMAAKRNILPRIAGRGVELEAYLGKGIKKMSAKADLMIINPPYIPEPPWVEEGSTSIDDPYKGTGLIREIIEEGIKHLNPDNPSAEIIMGYSSLAEQDVQEYLRAYGNLIDMETISEEITVPLKIERVDRLWLDWMKDKGLVIEKDVPVDGFKYWHKLKVVRITPKKAVLYYKDGGEETVVLRDIVLKRQDAERWNNLALRSKLEILTLLNIEPKAHLWFDDEWRELYQLVQYYEKNISAFKQVIEGQLNRKVHITAANLLSAFYSLDRFFAGNIIRDIYFGGKNPYILPGVIQALRGLINQTPPAIKKALIDLFKENFEYFSWDKAVTEYLKNEYQYEGGYEVRDINDFSIGSGVYKFNIALPEMPGCPQLEVFLKRAPPRYTDLRNEIAYLRCEELFLEGADIRKLPFYYNNREAPRLPGLLIAPPIERQSMDSKISEALLSTGAIEERVKDIDVQQEIALSQAPRNDIIRDAMATLRDYSAGREKRIEALGIISDNRQFVERKLSLKDTVDFHCHTTESDGYITPACVVLKAWLNGVKAVGIVDHVSLDGVYEAMRAAEILGGIEIIPGIEFYSEEKKLNLRQLHIVVYFPQIKTAAGFEEFRERIEGDAGYAKMKRVFENRTENIERIRRKFNELFNDQGLEITQGDMLSLPKKLVTLSELGILLFNKYGALRLGAGSADEAKKRYVDSARSHVISRGVTRMAVKEIMEMSARHNGVVSLTHPLRHAKDKDRMITKVRQLLEKYAAGFRAIGIYGSGNSKDDVLKLRTMIRSLCSENSTYKKFPPVMLNESDSHGRQPRELVLGERDQDGFYSVPPGAASYSRVLDLRRQAELTAGNEDTGKIKPVDEAFIREIVFMMVQHAVLGDILGRNDRHLSNTHVSVSGDWQIRNVVDFDINNMLDADTQGDAPWYLNYDWILEDIRQGVSEITLLALLGEYNVNSSKTELFRIWKERYIAKWKEIISPENIERIKDVIRDVYKETPDVVSQKIEVLEQRLKTDPEEFLKEIFCAQLVDYEIRKVYQRYLTLIKERGGDTQLGYLRKYIMPEGRVSVASMLEAFRGILGCEFLERRRIQGRKSIEEVFKDIEDLVTEVLGKKELKELRAEVSRIKKQADIIIDGCFADEGRPIIQLNVLILDDDANMLEVMGEALQCEEVRKIEKADTMERALEVLRGNPNINFIVSDFRLTDYPRENGVLFCRGAFDMGFTGRVIIYSAEDTSIINELKRYPVLWKKYLEGQISIQLKHDVSAIEDIKARIVAFARKEDRFGREAVEELLDELPFEKLDIKTEDIGIDSGIVEQFRDCHVIIADDKPFIRNAVRATLNNFFNNIYEAGTVEDVISLVEKLRAEGISDNKIIVISDYEFGNEQTGMRRKDGHDLLNILRLHSDADYKGEKLDFKGFFFFVSGSIVSKDQIPAYDNAAKDIAGGVKEKYGIDYIEKNVNEGFPIVLLRMIYERLRNPYILNSPIVDIFKSRPMSVPADISFLNGGVNDFEIRMGVRVTRLRQILTDSLMDIEKKDSYQKINDLLNKLRKFLDFGNVDRNPPFNARVHNYKGRIFYAASYLMPQIRKEIESLPVGDKERFGDFNKELDGLYMVMQTAANYMLRLLRLSAVVGDVYRPVYYEEFVEKTAGDFRRDYGADIKLDVEYHDEKIGDVEFPYALIFVVSYILNNAVEQYREKFGRDFKGKVDYKINKQTNNIEISIADEAGGIPEDILPNIFLRKFTTKLQGTGFGLFWARQLVGMFNGDISASNTGTGACFKITIPLGWRIIADAKTGLTAPLTEKVLTILKAKEEEDADESAGVIAGEIYRYSEHLAKVVKTREVMPGKRTVRSGMFKKSELLTMLPNYLKVVSTDGTDAALTNLIIEKGAMREDIENLLLSLLAVSADEWQIGMCFAYLPPRYAVVTKEGEAPEILLRSRENVEKEKEGITSEKRREYQRVLRLIAYVIHKMGGDMGFVLPYFVSSLSCLQDDRKEKIVESFQSKNPRDVFSMMHDYTLHTLNGSEDDILIIERVLDWSHVIYNIVSGIKELNDAVNSDLSGQELSGTDREKLLSISEILNDAQSVEKMIRGERIEDKEFIEIKPENTLKNFHLEVVKGTRLWLKKFFLDNIILNICRYAGYSEGMDICVRVYEENGLTKFRITYKGQIDEKNAFARKEGDAHSDAGHLVCDLVSTAGGSITARNAGENVEIIIGFPLPEESYDAGQSPEAEVLLSEFSQAGLPARQAGKLSTEPMNDEASRRRNLEAGREEVLLLGASV